MVAHASSPSFPQVVKRHALWSIVKFNALLNGIRTNALGRVSRYLDNKFGLARFDHPNPLQPKGHFPEIRSVPIYDPVEFEWVKLINDHAQEIRDEFLALRANGRLAPHPQKLTDAGSWNTYYLFSNGRKYESHCEECPTTAKIISQLPGGGTAGQAYFSVMSGGTHVKAHCGPTNTKIRCHLGLIVPDSSRIRVNDETINWKELECIVFDDSFEHEVWNPDEERAVLIIDLWHPDLTDDERWAVEKIGRLSGRHRNYRNQLKARR